MAAGNFYKQFGCRSSRKISGSGSKLLETRWAAVRHGCAGWPVCCIQQNHEFCGNEPAWSIEATCQNRLTLFLNIIYATDRQYLQVAVPSENLTMFKPAWKPLHPGKVTWLLKRYTGDSDLYTSLTGDRKEYSPVTGQDSDTLSAAMRREIIPT